MRIAMHGRTVRWQRKLQQQFSHMPESQFSEKTRTVVLAVGKLTFYVREAGRSAEMLGRQKGTLTAALG